MEGNILKEERMILISPYSKPLRNGKPNPKNYPYWEELVELLEKHTYVIQVGGKGEELIKGVKMDYIGISLRALGKMISSALLNEIKLFISVDNFFPHMAHYYNRQCVVLWGQSDPKLFGYSENINLLKDRKYLRPNQFDVW